MVKWAGKTIMKPDQDDDAKKHEDDDRSDRGGFEKWVRSEPGAIPSIDLGRLSSGQYTHRQVNHAWAIWQAARHSNRLQEEVEVAFVLTGDEKADVQLAADNAKLAMQGLANALEAILKNGLSADEARLCMVACNAPFMSNPNNPTGISLHARCDQIAEDERTARAALDAARKEGFMYTQTNPVGEMLGEDEAKLTGCQCVCHRLPEHGKLQDALEALEWHQKELAIRQQAMQERVKELEESLVAARSRYPTADNYERLQQEVKNLTWAGQQTDAYAALSSKLSSETQRTDRLQAEVEHHKETINRLSARGVEWQESARFQRAAIQGLADALRALMEISHINQPRKLDAALRWRENDDAVKEMCRAALDAAKPYIKEEA